MQLNIFSELKHKVDGNVNISNVVLFAKKTSEIKERLPLTPTQGLFNGKRRSRDNNTTSMWIPQPTNIEQQHLQVPLNTTFPCMDKPYAFE